MRAKILQFYVAKPRFSFMAWVILSLVVLSVYLSAMILFVADFLIYAYL